MTMNTLADWTLLTYIAAHNNLDSAGTRSRDQILATPSTDKVKLAVLFDSWGGATRQIVGQPEEPMHAYDSGDPARLLETIKWAFEKCPAKRYGLVLWSHGSGYWDQKELIKIAKQARGEMAAIEAPERDGAARSMALFRTTLQHILAEPDAAERAILFDDGTGHSVDTLELAKVCAHAQQLIGQPIDLLGMDACVMATLEVAYELRESVRYLVASEELVPGRSWPYDTILSKLRAHPEMSGADLATQVVQDYAAYYAANPPLLNGGDVTKVALDLARINELCAPVQALAAALRQHMPEEYKALWAAQYEAQIQETHNKRRNPKLSKFGYHLWDVGSLAVRLAEKAQQPAVKAAAAAIGPALKPGAGAVLAEAHQGEWFDGIGGVSIYMAPPRLPVSSAYGKLALAKDTGWGAMLKDYKAEI